MSGEVPSSSGVAASLRRSTSRACSPGGGP